MKNLRDTYKHYISKCKKIISIDDYMTINSLYNKFLIQKVLEGFEVTLPARLGTLSITGKRQNLKIENGIIKGLAPDWVKTKKLWDNNPEAKEKKKLMYHTNPHTDNVRYKYLWSKKRVLIENKTLYSLRLTRTNKRLVSKKIKEGKQYKTIG